MRYAMMIELDACVGCQACVTSCKERWDSGPGAARDWVMTFSYGSREEATLGLTFYPGLCNHCDDHPCTADCPTEATYMTSNGIVVVDPEICIGCGNCVSKCPYGARHADPRKGIVEKCNFCAPYVARGERPACVATCLAECRHFGDLDDPKSEVSRLIRTRRAKPLVTNEIDVGPHVYYAPEELRLQVLAQGVVRSYGSTLFTSIYQRVTTPLARWAIAPIIVITGLVGVAVNLRLRLKERQPGPEMLSEAPAEALSEAPAEALSEAPLEASSETSSDLSAAPSVEAADAAADAATTERGSEKRLLRHRAGMRFLHWFNLLSWVLLLGSGTALMANVGFALFGQGFPRRIAALAGGHGNLIWFHAVYGLLWAIIIIPLFLYYKRGGLEAIREISLTFDDMRWLFLKPLVMVGLVHKRKLPPQDKYNAGQKLFAVSALAGTTIIVLTGAVMAFHLGSAEVVRAAILVHKLAVMLALAGIAVHVTMAAIIVEERPALWSMIVGEIERQHAEEHASRWVEAIDRERRAGGAGGVPAKQGDEP